MGDSRRDHGRLASDCRERSVPRLRDIDLLALRRATPEHFLRLDRPGCREAIDPHRQAAPYGLAVGDGMDRERLRSARPGSPCPEKASTELRRLWNFTDEGAMSEPRELFVEQERIPGQIAKVSGDLLSLRRAKQRGYEPSSRPAGLPAGFPALSHHCVLSIVNQDASALSSETPMALANRCLIVLRLSSRLLIRKKSSVLLMPYVSVTKRTNEPACR
jgi:hypothetical protein